MQGWSKFDKGSVDPETGVERKISPVKLGYGLGLESIKVYDNFSLHCMQNELSAIIPRTLARTKEQQTVWRENFKSIENMLSDEKVHFFVRNVNPEAVIEVDERPEISPKQIRIHGWYLPDDSGSLKAGGNGGSREEGMQPIDILQEHAIRHTNSDNIMSACVLLKLAIRARALRMPVYDDRYQPHCSGHELTLKDAHLSHTLTCRYRAGYQPHCSGHA